MNLFAEKRINEASDFDSYHISIAYNIFLPVVSAFYTVNESTKGYDVELAGFNQLVNDRKEYLGKLPKLNENWISGKSSLPSGEVIEKSKNLLDDFNNYLIRKKRQNMQIDIPKLVMGPIPTGGIGVEFHVNSENALYVNIHNNSSVEIEIKYYDFYSTIEPADFNREIIADYELLTCTNRNSGWGNSLPLL